MNREILDFYNSYGLSLDNIGINEKVIPLNLFNNFLNICIRNKILILGGDLYIKIDEAGFEPTYDNWYYDGLSYVQSVEIAKLYLIKIKGENLYISFITK